MGACLIIAHKIKHIMYRYFPEKLRCEGGLSYIQENSMVYINTYHKIVWKITHADKEILSLLMLSSFIPVMNTQKLFACHMFEHQCHNMNRVTSLTVNFYSFSYGFHIQCQT